MYWNLRRFVLILISTAFLLCLSVNSKGQESNPSAIQIINEMNESIDSILLNIDLHSKKTSSKEIYLGKNFNAKSTIRYFSYCDTIKKKSTYYEVIIIKYTNNEINLKVSVPKKSRISAKYGKKFAYIFINKDKEVNAEAQTALKMAKQSYIQLLELLSDDAVLAITSE